MKNEITIKTRVSETVHHFIKHGHTLENVHPFIFSTANDRALSKTSESKFADHSSFFFKVYEGNTE
jgi:hypothetical protein